MSTLIFEKSRGGRRAFAQAPVAKSDIDIPSGCTALHAPFAKELLN